MGILLGLVSLALLTIPLWRIMQRAGFSPWLSLLALVPVVNVIALWLFAFGRWPAADDQAAGVSPGKSFWSSPLSNISWTMSAPPMNSPPT